MQAMGWSLLLRLLPTASAIFLANGVSHTISISCLWLSSLARSNSWKASTSAQKRFSNPPPARRTTPPPHKPRQISSMFSSSQKNWRITHPEHPPQQRRGHHHPIRPASSAGNGLIRVYPLEPQQLHGHGLEDHGCRAQVNINYPFAELFR